MKIGVYFWGCNKLDWQAFEYLLLTLNKTQSLFEFEVHSSEIFRKGPEIRGKVDFDSNIIFDQFKKALILYRQEIQNITSDPNTNFDQSGSSISEYAIAIIERKVKGEFYVVTDSPFAIISIGDWRKKYAPPSAVEFLLSTIIGACVELLDKENKISHHVATRGCLFDFNNSVNDAKNSVLIKYICSDCEDKIKNTFGEDFIKELKKITDRDWIGNYNDVGSVAYNLKRVFYYDLTKTRGFKASPMERISQKFTETFAETAAKTFFVIIIVIIITVLGLKGLLQYIK